MSSEHSKIESLAFIQAEWVRRSQPSPCGFLTVYDVTNEQFLHLIEEGIRFKLDSQYGHGALNGKSVALVFQKTSTRTRVSFELGIAEMGGAPLFIDWRSSNFTLSALEDEIAVLSRYCHLIVARVYHHHDLLTMKQHASVPIVNGLCDLHHPCQALSDMVTIRHVFGSTNVNLLYIGDGNNVCHSLIQAATVCGANIRVITPPADAPQPSIVAQAGDSVQVGHQLDAEWVRWADVIYTDTWVSMGQETEAEDRMIRFMPYQVSESVMAMAPSHAVFMHCLPAHRGAEVSSGVLDSPQSIILDQAENRKHAQKALLVHLLT